MTTTLIPPQPLTALAPDFRRRKTSREDCDCLEQAGRLTERYELIDGEILLKMPQHRPHVLTLFEVVDCLTRLFGADYIQMQLPIEVRVSDRTYNYPEPDVVVLKNPRKTYRDLAPVPSEVRLLVEISDSTLSGDLIKKAELYARSEIAFYWVADVANRQLHLHSNPKDGGYTVTTYREGEIVPIGDTGETVPVADLFPSR